MTAGRARALLVLATASWGLTFVANHELLEELSPAHITSLRFSVVSLALGTLVAAVPRLRPRLSRRDVGLLVVGGLFAVPGAQLALTQGQQYLSPAMSGLVVATGPAFISLLAIWFLGERLGGLRWGGVALAFSGAAVVILFTTGAGTDLVVRNPWGGALVALAQLCWASYTVLSKNLVARHAPVAVVTVAVCCGTLFLLPALPGALAAAATVPPRTFLWLGHLALFGTVVPYLIWFTALRQLPANETAAFMFLVPLCAVGWSVTLLGERPAALGILGGLAIVAGVAITQFAPRPRTQAGDHQARPGTLAARK
jgi:drug/metabolite transporter (DMT)-like permease